MDAPIRNIHTRKKTWKAASPARSTQWTANGVARKVRTHVIVYTHDGALGHAARIANAAAQPARNTQAPATDSPAGNRRTAV